MISRRGFLITASFSLSTFAAFAAGCTSRPKPSQTVVGIIDNTDDYTRSVGFPAATAEGTERLIQAAHTLPRGGNVYLFTPADCVNYVPYCVATWRKDIAQNGKPIAALTARRSHDAALAALITNHVEIARRHPVVRETRLMETIDSVLQTLGKQVEDGNTGQIVLVSDMEPFTHHEGRLVSAAQIVASEKTLMEHVNRVKQTYSQRSMPGLTVTVIYTPSVAMAQLTPEKQERLKRFWIAFFTHLGVRQVEWIHPAPKAI